MREIAPGQVALLRGYLDDLAFACNWPAGQGACGRFFRLLLSQWKLLHWTAWRTVLSERQRRQELPQLILVWPDRVLAEA